MRKPGHRRANLRLGSGDVLLTGVFPHALRLPLPGLTVYLAVSNGSVLLRQATFRRTVLEQATPQNENPAGILANGLLVLETSH